MTNVLNVILPLCALFGCSHLLHKNSFQVYTWTTPPANVCVSQNFEGNKPAIGSTFTHPY